MMKFQTKEGKIFNAVSFNRFVSRMEQGTLYVAKVILDPVAPVVAIEPEGDAQIGSVVLRAVVSNEDAMDALSYQWYFSDLKKDLPFAEPIIGATNAEYTPAGIKEGGVGSGYYKVIV